MRSSRRGTPRFLTRLTDAAGLKTMAPSIASLMSGDVVSAVASLIGIAFLARRLGPAEFGQIVFAQATVGIIFSVLDPRVEDGVIRYMPLVQTRAGGGASSRLFKRALVFDQALGVLAAVILIMLFSLLLQAPHATSTVFLLWAIAQAGAQAAIGTASAGFAVTEGLAALGALRSVAATAGTAVSILSLVLGGGVAYMVAQAATAAVFSLTLATMALRRVNRSYGPPTALPRGAAIGFLPFTLKSSLSITVNIGTNNLPLTIVGSVGGAAFLALYKVALAPSRLVTTGFSSVAAVMFPKLSEDAAAGRIDLVRSRALSTTAILSLPASVGAIVAWFSLPFLVPLVFGNPYTSAATAAWILASAALVRGVVIWSKVLPLAIGRAGLKLFISCIDGLLVSGAAWWGTAHGLLAIAWGQFAAAVIFALIWLWLASSLGGGAVVPVDSISMIEGIAGGDEAGSI